MVIIERNVKVVKVPSQKNLTLLKDIQNKRKTTKLISIKCHGNNINLHPLIMKFDQAFNIFDGIDNKCNKLNEYKPRTSNKINAEKRNARVIENYDRKADWYVCCS